MSTPYSQFTTRPEIRGTFGMVASTHWIASSVAMSMLERGGNAFDAAAAAGFVLQVIEPHLNGPGGEVPIILWSALGQRAHVICGQGVAPKAATADSFRAMGLNLVPGTGLLPACVPGAFDAWMLLLRDHGTLPIAMILEPAIHYAEEGYPLVPRIVAAITAVQKLFSSEWRSSAAIYLPNGKVPSLGKLFSNRMLARTYRRVLAEAADGGADRVRQIEAARRAWYRGFVADAIDRFCRTEVLDTSGERHRGLLTGDDLAAWQATIEAPLSYDYAGPNASYSVAKCGPWSQAPAFLQSLALLQRFDLRGLDPLGPELVHTIVECVKLALADRDCWYGDPTFADVPMRALLSDVYSESRAKLVGEYASFDLRPGSPEGRIPRLPDLDAGLRDVKVDEFFYGIGEPTFADLSDEVPGENGVFRSDTCHVDVIDRWGNMVSATPSGGWLSSSPVIPELGFPLGTRAQMFWLDEGHPAQIAPRKRPRTTLSPTLAFRDGEPWAVFGTPGGDQQDQWALAMFLRVVHCGMNWQEAIDCPAWHTKHAPTSFWPRRAQPGVLSIERRFPAATLRELERRGHRLVVGEPWSEGRLSVCAKEPPLLKAAANPRGMQGYAVGR